VLDFVEKEQRRSPSPEKVELFRPSQPTSKSKIGLDESHRTRRLLDPAKLAEMAKPPDEVPDLEQSTKMLETRSALAISLQAALDLPSADEESFEDGFETEQPAVFFIGDREVAFPVARDEESRELRAQGMRACLRREIGAEKLSRVMGEIRGCEANDNCPTPVCDSLSLGIVMLARQLFILEQDR